MAYFIFNNDNDIVNISANDADRDSLNINLTDYIVKDVSDSDFNKLKLESHLVSFDGTNVSFTDREISTFSNFGTKEEIDEKISLIKIKLKNFLSNNSGHSKYTECENYYNYLNSLDTSTLTFPLNKTWEQYCSDNSISFIHTLQIP